MPRNSKHFNFSLGPDPPGDLLTRDQVVAELVREIEAESLTAVSMRTGIKMQQLSDIRYGRARLSARVVEKLGYELVAELYKKLEG